MDLGSLTQKKGPLPVWVWALIVAVILYVLYRHFKGSSSSATSTAATDTGSTDGNIASLPDASSTVSPSEFGGVSTPADTLPNTGVDQVLETPWWVDPTAGPPMVDPIVPPLSSPDPTTAPAPGRANPPTPGIPAVKPAAKPVAAIKSIIPGITGTIKSQKVLPSGAKLVTLTSGRQIEQAKGKKAYVVKK